VPRTRRPRRGPRQARLPEHDGPAPGRGRSTRAWPPLDAAQFVTHHFDLNDFEKAYDVFANPEASAALKVVLTRSEGSDG
jgi:hypothetical protein